MDIQGLVAIVFFFTTVCIVVGSYIFTRHRERMGMIDRGLKADDIRAIYSNGQRPGDPLISLKWGILLVSAGLAISIGMMLRSVLAVEGGVFPALISLFAGIGLLVYYRIAKGRISA